ncbi:restriction endonuclease [Achromobacter xylosoxidans]
MAQAAAAMSWQQFAATVEAGFRRDGCEVERLQGPGADFALTKDGHVAMVGAKRWRRPRASASSRCANCRRAEKRGAREAIYIALGEVSDNALQYARAEGVSLMTASGPGQPDPRRRPARPVADPRAAAAMPGGADANLGGPAA